MDWKDIPQKLARLYTFDPETDLPSVVYVEITGACNLQCPLCPRTYSTRKRGNMSDELFHQVIEDIVTGMPTLPTLGFHFFGEIELKKNFEELVGWARGKLPKTYFGISTTLTLVQPTLVTKLLTAGFDSIGVWPDGFSEESYAQIRTGGSYAMVKANLRSLLDQRNQLRKEQIDVHVGMVSNALNNEHVEQFLKEFAFIEAYPNTRLVTMDSHDWAGQIPSANVVNSVSKYKWKARKPCNMPFTTLVVSAAGEASLCCYDMDLKLHVGTFEKGVTLRQLWASEKAEAIRQGMRRLDPPDLCKQCHNFYLDLTPQRLFQKMRRGLSSTKLKRYVIGNDAKAPTARVPEKS